MILVWFRLLFTHELYQLFFWLFKKLVIWKSLAWNFLLNLSTEDGCSEVRIIHLFLMCSDDTLSISVCCISWTLSIILLVVQNFDYMEKASLEFFLKVIFRLWMFRGAGQWMYLFYNFIVNFCIVVCNGWIYRFQFFILPVKFIINFW